MACARGVALACALVFACVSSVVAQQAQSHVVVQVEGDLDRKTVIARIAELVSALGVLVRAQDGFTGDQSELLAHLVITRSAASQVQIEIVAWDEQHTTREVPLPNGRVDELAREAIATVCASGVQALLDERDAAAPREANASATPQEPQTPPVAEAPSPEPAPAPVERPKPKPAPQVIEAQEKPEAPPPKVVRAPEGELLFALGYEVFLWGDGRVLHGPRGHARYALVSASALRFAFGLEAMISLPSTRDESVFDVDLSTWSLHLLAEPELALSKRFALSFPMGLGLQVVTAFASAADSGTTVGNDSQRFSVALLLRPTLSWRFAPAWSLALGAGIEFHPMQVRYGLSHPDGFGSVSASGYVRPAATLEVGFSF